MRLLQPNSDGDAECADMRKGKKRAVPRPILPIMPHPATDDDAGGWCDVLRAIFGEILRGNVRHIYHTIQDALREDFLQ